MSIPALGGGTMSPVSVEVLKFSLFYFGTSVRRSNGLRLLFCHCCCFVVVEVLVVVFAVVNVLLFLLLQLFFFLLFFSCC